MGEIDKRSEIFLFMITWLTLIDVALDNLWILLGENWCWSLLGLKGLRHQRYRRVLDWFLWLIMTINIGSQILIHIHRKECTLYPFKSQYQHTNSPNWSPYISLLREFNNRSRYFLFSDHLLILITVALDNYWILLGEKWCW